MFNNHKHLIDISEYSDTELMTILQTAKAFSEVNERAIKKVPTLKMCIRDRRRDCLDERSG